MRNGIIGGLIAGPILAIVGYFVAFHIGKPILDNARQSDEWPKVAGIIERSEVVTSRGDDSTMYEADVVYKYQVTQREYRNGTVTFGGNFSSSSSSSAYAVTNRYPVGRKVDVFYEPEEPANSVLEPGTSWRSYLLFGVGMVLLALGILVVATPLLYIAGAALIAGGAVAGLIGKRPQQFRSDRFEVDSDTEPSERNTAEHKSSPEKPRPESTVDDDGFDMG